MVGAVFTEIFAADVFITVFSVCTAYITALVAKKLNFVFLLSGEIGEFIQGFVQAKVGDYIGKIVTVKLVYKLRNRGGDNSLSDMKEAGRSILSRHFVEAGFGKTACKARCTFCLKGVLLLAGNC